MPSATPPPAHVYTAAEAAHKGAFPADEHYPQLPSIEDLKKEGIPAGSKTCRDLSTER